MTDMTKLQEKRTDCDRELSSIFSEANIDGYVHNHSGSVAVREVVRDETGV